MRWAYRAKIEPIRVFLNHDLKQLILAIQPRPGFVSYILMEFCQRHGVVFIFET